MKMVGHIKVDVHRSNIIGIMIFFVCYFIAFQGFGPFTDQSNNPLLRFFYRIIILFYLIVLLCVHEAIHKIVASFFVSSKNVTLHCKLKSLVWECHVSVPLKRNQYLLVLLAPGIILFLTGALLSFALEPTNLKYFAMLLFLYGFASAVGDILLASKSIKFPKNCYILAKGAEADILINDLF